MSPKTRRSVAPTARMMEQLTEGYEQSFGAAADVEEEWPEVVQAAMKVACLPGDSLREIVSGLRCSSPNRFSSLIRPPRVS